VICQIKHKKGIKEEQLLPQMGEDVHFNTMGLAQHSTTEQNYTGDREFVDFLTSVLKAY
jgi:hypothetical protein